MGTSDGQYTYCTCTLCLLVSPDGDKQTIRTEKAHLIADRKRAITRTIAEASAGSNSSAHICSHTPPRLPSPINSELQRRIPSPQPLPDIDDNSDDDLFQFEQSPADVQDMGELGDFQWSIDDEECDNGRAPSYFHFSSDSEDDNVDFLANNTPSSSDEEDEPVEAGSDNVDVDDIRTDPLFRSQQSLFDAFQPGSDPLPENIPAKPWAFDDHPAIHNACIYWAEFCGQTRGCTLREKRGGYTLLSRE
ncbi:hypothetical protein C8J57DRAFT_1535229 [Mycena rebaudengoi]|nr:hypothetical protein C8J57DRAFT_1535229 [Mycena rebaudengoi]